ncbi:hypothetical protein HYH03_003004 [Edaphochlamys debaryana]|uniref:Uncharacterized protein n=1 Tax=Edaphochlamys debaryana TaxID=47281 RepID=A0A835YA41_9CHLO|nr:hypothetical protein HYH03_003004 [Edaphochlamys debaryana]|eukprot:KAG2498811.1 hypothetical protein HYH03_003004 [Edaphochlamys debaryana]
MRDVESGQFAAPRAFDVLSRYRTEQLSLNTSDRPRIQLPEAPFVRAFLQKYPEAKSEPVALNSFAPPLARQFAQRQLELIQSGQDTAAAFAQAEKDFAARIQALRSRYLASATGSTNPLELLRQAEQEALDAGLEALAETQRR